MEIVSEQALVNLLRKKCNQVRTRLWVASPYIGSFSAVRSILGSKWLSDPLIGVRLLTDVEELGRLSRETVEAFAKRGIVKQIRGLHAKIYVVDDEVLITSANLTGTAFSKRYEVGSFLTAPESKPFIDLFETWWGGIAQEVPFSWFEDFVQSKAQGESREEKEGTHLPTLWNLPQAPQIPKQGQAPSFLDYYDFCSKYSDFANKYSAVQRISPDMPLYFETDAFLDFLFHHGTQPSFKYRRVSTEPLRPPRKLNGEQKLKEIREYAASFRQWVKDGSDITWRQEASHLIRKTLKSTNLKNLQSDAIENVVRQLNCMNSLPLNRARFLNPQNNDIDSIRSAWFNLLYGNEDLPTRMAQCKQALRYFGRSSIQELLGFYAPDKYPLRNSNSNAGLRFFGYDVSID